MTNNQIVKYVINQDNGITDVILPLKNYLVILKVLIQQATLASLNLSTESLKMPNNSEEFLRFIVKAAKNNWDSELNIKDEKLAEIVGVTSKTIQTKLQFSV